MKHIYSFCLVLLSLSVQAQITTPVIKAGFGVEGDLRANYYNGFVQSGNDDWFNDGTPGMGTFIIDTLGAAAILNRYNTDPAFRQQPFFRGMRYPQFSVINNRMLIDGIFIRDHHGDDSTVFASGSNKNAMSPQDWSCPVSQGVPDKNDILDMMVHVRRAGPDLTDSLWMFGGVSLENTTGNRYFDFEMYQTDIYYDKTQLKFFGYGPDAGHTSWKFDASGNILTAGDIIFTAEYSSSALSYVEARIWVHKDDLLITPVAFNWGGSFDGATAGATYGYANIVPKTAGSFYTGIQSVNNTWAGPFALIRQDNSIAANYNARQFMEFSVNLSKLGLDPLVTIGDPCAMPFRRVLVKTRSSTSFNAELKDFVGPFAFFRAPRVDAQADIPVFCGSIGVSNINIVNALPTSLYTWRTDDGHIVGDTVGSNITVDQQGTYIVSQQLLDSCGFTYAMDTVTIALDSNCFILPVQLLQFNGNINGDQVLLNWSVSNQKDILHYTIERSEDLLHYSPAGTVTVGDWDRYKFRDQVPAGSKVLYYRIKMTDINGVASYSKIIALNPVPFVKPGLLITPNPADRQVQVAISSMSNTPAALFIHNQSGKLITAQTINLQAGTTVVQVPGVVNWPAGFYLVSVTMDSGQLNGKLIIAR